MTDPTQAVLASAPHQQGSTYVSLPRVLLQHKADSSGNFIAITLLSWVEIRRRVRRLPKSRPR